jgi:hypothetical protein
MLLRVIMSVIIVLLCIVALISPVLVDAHRWYWWLHKRCIIAKN